MKKTRTYFSLVVLVLVLVSCTSDPNSPGLEYMPDMYRSPAIEAYVDYGQDPYNFDEELAQEQRMTPSARQPVAGTIPYAGMSEEEMALSMPYPYENTTEDYDRAGAELKSPLEATDEHFKKGEELYQKMCSHCHGKTGVGDGAISTNGKILGIPSFAEKLKDLPEGNMFHTLTYGKGLMGSHASQLDQKERWQVIQFVQSLQSAGASEDEDAEGDAAAGDEGNEAADGADAEAGDADAGAGEPNQED
jgi:mono/diheme cytochrome c family protein